MIRKGLRPAFRLGFDFSDSDVRFRRVFRFRRSWVAIAILAVMDAIFLFPAITTFMQAAGQWSQFDSLFDLTAALFLSAWLLGWSIAPLIMTTILVLLLFGREVLRVRQGVVEIMIGLPGFGLWATFDVTKMRNLRFEEPPKKSGKSWRGPHLTFDYGANEYSFGSGMSPGDVSLMRNEIQMASGKVVRRGEATPEELEAQWEKPALISEPAGETAAAQPAAPVSLVSPSTLALIAANLIPLAGTVFMGWRLSDVMVLYWAESAIIGFYNVCKIAVIGRWMALLAGPFFIGHFGAFMAVHFLFIYTLFVQGAHNSDGGGDLTRVAALFMSLWPALLALFLSHGVSFFTNFLGRKEYLSRTVQTQMSEPYSRIIFMHLVLIFGGGLSLVLGEPAPVILGVIVLKLIFDVRGHIRERSRGQEKARRRSKAQGKTSEKVLDKPG